MHTTQHCGTLSNVPYCVLCPTYQGSAIIFNAARRKIMPLLALGINVRDNLHLKAILKLIIFPKKLSRQLSSQLCNQKFSSRQLSSKFFFLQQICQGNCQINCVTQHFLQDNCEVNYLLKYYFIFFVNYCDF